MMQGHDQTLTIRFESIYNPPKTGDDSNIPLWIALGIISAGGLGFLLFYNKKKK